MTRVFTAISPTAIAKRAITVFASTCLVVSLGGAAQAIEFSVGPKEVIYTKSQRTKKGGANWPDGNFGIVANGDGSYDFYGANGSKPVMTTGSLDDPAWSKKSVKIHNVPKKTFNYVSGGPVYEDPATGARLMIYHAEKHGKSKKDFYSVLGMAISTDPNGLVFNDLGVIVEPNLQFGRTEVNGGSFAVFDNQLHVYYRDWFPGGATAELAVARAPIWDVIHNGLSGFGTSFTKYYDGSWSQPGIGGLASGLEVGNPSNGWHAVSYNDHLDQLVMVTSHYTSAQPDLYLATSADGVNWSPRQPVVVEPGEQFYPSLVGTGPDPTHTGQSFYLYYTDSQKGAWSRWKDGQLVRRAITLGSPYDVPVGPPPQSPPPQDAPSYDWELVSDFQSDFQAGSPATGWTYAWNPLRRLDDSWKFLPLRWSDVAQGYNTTGGVTQQPDGKIHPDDYMVLWQTGGHPGQAGYLPIMGYTIQNEDGGGLYRIAESSIRKFDGTLGPLEDGLQVLVYVNNAPLGPAQYVSTNGLLTNFDRELGELNVGDTVWVMVDPLGNNAHDLFVDFDFSLQKAAPMTAQLSAMLVPEPAAGTIALVVFACLANRRRRYC